MKLVSTNMHHMLADSELLKKYQSTEDIHFLSELFHRHMHRVYGICLKYLENREDSKDAVMQIFEVIVNDTLKTDIENFKNWLGVVSRNYCLMQIRTNISKRNRLKKFQSENFMESTVEIHPIEESDNEVTDLALKECLEALKTLQKNCINLFYYKKKCYKEISEFLKIEEKKVKSQIQNAKRNLKLCLEKKNVVYGAK